MSSVVAPVVATTSGAVQGEPTERGLVFRGIPFAEPPVGHRRLRPPVSPAPWQGIRPPVQSPRCPPSNVITPTGRVPPDEALLAGSNEDCLLLTLWTPELDGALPVLLWIHGGGFTEGAGALELYDGSRLAAAGCVVVAINYRLHALGFLWLDDDPATANLGLLDQVRALEWVRENIASFGGDPERVTVFGESAGGVSVAALLAMPAARGLFRRAILQSGFGSLVHDIDTSRALATNLWQELGLTPGDRDAFEQLPVLDICRAAFRVTEHEPRQSFRPTVDGVSLPLSPTDALGSGSAAAIDLLLGTCADEARLFHYWPGLESALPGPDIASLFAGTSIGADAVRKLYMNERPYATERELMAAIVTDEMFEQPMTRMAELQVHHNPRVWVYRFAWRTPASGGVFGACHVLDLPFLFGTYDAWGDFVGDDPPRSLGDAMRAAWVRFGATGDPGGNGLPLWPAYDLEQRPVLELDDPSRVVHDPRAAIRRLWAARRAT